MTAIFEWLFKYRPLLYERGTIDFQPLWPWYISWILVAAALAGSWLLYRRSSAVLSNAWRWGLTALRACAFLVVLLILAQPVLRLYSVVPQQNFVAVAYDFSKSMDIRDEAGSRSRLDEVKQILRPADNPLLEALESKFKLRYFRFSGSAERSESFPEDSRRGDFTDLQQSLERILEELATVPLAGIVLMTDGADNHSNDLEGIISRLRAHGIPVYSVGVGSENYPRDAEIVRITAPATVLKDSVVETEIAIRSVGYPERSARLVVTDQDRQLENREITLGSDGEVKTFKVNVRAQNAGSRIIRFNLEALPDETVPQNNSGTVMVDVEDERPKILYVEGEPRWEHGFLQRAVQEDENLHLISLLRQAEGNFLRQGIESPGTLEKGFPEDTEELFRYKGVILGSIEAGFFTFEQLRMISDFVSRRGGGFLMLGGRSAFAQGGYAGTPLEDMLPLYIDGSADDVPGFQSLEFKVRLTGYGAQHPICRISLSEDENRMRWESAPNLNGFNATAGPKPGATVLLRGSVPEDDRLDPVILAFQRFGRGKAAAFTADSSWQWRMGLDHEDNFHELFWRQMLRWLVSDVPDPLSVTAEKQSYSPDDVAVLQVEANDASFVPLDNVRLSAHVQAPSGQLTPLSFNWDYEKSGSYSGTFKPLEEGVHEVVCEAFQGNRSLGRAKTHFLVAESTEEFRRASLNSGLLRRLSSETGGRYYSANELGTLADDISYTDKGASQLEEKDLWDMPFLFLLLIGLVSTEWIFRKRKGLS
jgi:uncharacterized membrane protein